MSPVLEVEDLSLRYGAVSALRGVSVSVDAGEIVTVVGANGAGKSSLVKAICGLAPAQNGAVRLLGEEILGRSPEEICRRGVAVVPEGRRVFGSLTVGENLRLAAVGRRRRRGRGHARTPLSEDGLEQVLALFPAVGAALRRQADSLSGGQAQQLAIARALMQRPKLLILDEPSLGLAPVIVEEIFQLVDDLRHDGMTILLIEQNVINAVALADRSIVLNTGRVVLSADRTELPASDVLASAVFGVN